MATHYAAQINSLKKYLNFEIDLNIPLSWLKANKLVYIA